MEIVRLTEVSDAVVIAYNKLLPQLAPDCKLITKEYLQEIIDSACTAIFLAKEKDVVIGVFTLLIFKIPTGIKASIEDVIVDNNFRGKGIGEKLIRFAIDFAPQLGVSKIDLTSNPSRIAANALYQKIGFEKRETNVYRFDIK